MFRGKIYFFLNVEFMLLNLVILDKLESLLQYIYFEMSWVNLIVVIFFYVNCSIVNNLIQFGVFYLFCEVQISLR